MKLFNGKITKQKSEKRGSKFLLGCLKKDIEKIGGSEKNLGGPKKSQEKWRGGGVPNEKKLPRAFFY